MQTLDGCFNVAGVRPSVVTEAVAEVVTMANHVIEASSADEQNITVHNNRFFLARTASRCRRAYILPLLFLSPSFLLSSFLSPYFRLLISELAKRISTKLGHMFTYDCPYNSLLNRSLKHGQCVKAIKGLSFPSVIRLMEVYHCPFSRWRTKPKHVFFCLLICVKCPRNFL